MYKKYKLPLIQKYIIIRESDNANIPMDESNNDYQEYLKWVADGNTAQEITE